jgi:hypothetical protein
MQSPVGLIVLAGREKKGGFAALLTLRRNRSFTDSTPPR